MNKIDKIIKKTRSGHGGTVKKYVDWLIPGEQLEKGITLLKKEDSEHLLKLINFNYEIKSLVLHEFIRIEGFITTRFSIAYGSTKLNDISGEIFRSEKGFDKFKSIVTEKFGQSQVNKTINDLFSKITFGTKQIVLSLLSFEKIKGGFLNGKEISKKEFLKIIRLSVEIRNKAAHNIFIAHSDFIPTLIIKPSEGYGGTSEQYYIDRINFVLSIFGESGFDKRIKKLMKKYDKFLKFTYFKKQN